MKKRWPVLILTLIFTLSLAAGAIAAAAPAGSQAATNSAERVENDEFASFIEDLFAGYSVEITDEQMDVLHDLFDQIAVMEANEDYIDAFDQWNAFYDQTGPIWDSAVYEYPSFDEFMEGWMPENITAADRDRLEKLYNQAVALEEKQDWEGSAAKWDEFYTILEPYWAEEDWSDEEWSDEYWSEEYYDGWEDLEEWEYPSFEEFYGEAYLNDLGLSEAERAEMESLYNEAVALEESGDWDGAAEKWDALWEIENAHYDEYCANYEYPSFDDFIAEFPADYTPRALDQMRQLYDEAVALEQNGDWEAASEKWDALYYIMDRFGAFDGYYCEDCAI